jgi:hypothetical protein
VRKLLAVLLIGNPVQGDCAYLPLGIVDRRSTGNQVSSVIISTESASWLCLSIVMKFCMFSSVISCEI